MSGKVAFGKDSTTQAWARVWRGVNNQVHLIAPVALLVVVGVALNVLPFPLNYLIAAAIFGGALYNVVPRFFANNEPTEAEVRASIEGGEKLREQLLKEEEQRQVAESNKAKKRHSKLLARLSREDKDKRRQLEKERREAAATRREKQAAKDADEDEEEFVPVSFGRPATVPSGTGAEADDAAGMFDDDDDDDEAFAAKRLVGGRMKQQRSRR